MCFVDVLLGKKEKAHTQNDNADKRPVKTHAKLGFTAELNNSHKPGHQCELTRSNTTWVLLPRLVTYTFQLRE